MKFFTPEVHRLFLDTPGALSVHEATALADLATIVPDVGTVVECGSHAGKSAIALAAGFATGHPRTIHMIDPIFDPEIAAHCEWGYAREDAFAFNVASKVMTAGKKNEEEGQITAITWPRFSMEALPEIFEEKGPFAFAFLDSGDHSYSLVRSEFDFLKDKMVPGGIIALHDFRCYVGPTKLYFESHNEGFSPVNICWDEIHELVEAHGGESLNIKSWHKVHDPRPQFLAALRKT